MTGAHYRFLSFFSLSFSLQLISFLMRCSLLTGFQLGPMPPTVTAVYLKNPGWRKGLEQALLTVSLCTVPVLRDPSHANLIYITQLRKDEEMVSHIVGLSAWFAFQLHLLKSLCLGKKVNVEHCESQGLLHICR